MQILNTAEKYIEKYNLDISPEQLFIEFQQIIALHESFNEYLKEEKLNAKLEKMKRNKRLLEKRKLFIAWYALKNQNQKMAKEIFIDLSEMVFASERTVQIELKNE